MWFLNELANQMYKKVECEYEEVKPQINTKWWNMKELGKPYTEAERRLDISNLNRNLAKFLILEDT